MTDTQKQALEALVTAQLEAHGLALAPAEISRAVGWLAAFGGVHASDEKLAEVAAAEEQTAADVRACVRSVALAAFEAGRECARSDLRTALVEYPGEDEALYAALMQRGVL